VRGLRYLVHVLYSTSEKYMLTLKNICCL
jgi:hypothetical protein